MSGDKVTEESFNDGLETTLAQVSPLFVEKTEGLTTYQLNLIRAICDGYHTDFGKSEVTSKYVEKEIMEITESGCYLADPLFEYWFKHEMM